MTRGERSCSNLGPTPGIRGRRLLGGKLELRGGGLLGLKMLDEAGRFSHGQVVELVVEHFRGQGIDLLFGNALTPGNGEDSPALGVAHGRRSAVSDPGRRGVGVPGLRQGRGLDHRLILAAFSRGVLPGLGLAPALTAEVGVFHFDVGGDPDVRVGAKDPGQRTGGRHANQMLGDAGGSVGFRGVSQIGKDLAFGAGQGCLADCQVPVVRAGELDGFHFQGADAHGMAQIEQARVLHELPAFDADDEPGVKGRLGFGTAFITSAFRGHWGPSFLSSVSPGCPGRSFRPPRVPCRGFGQWLGSCSGSFLGFGVDLGRRWEK